MALKGPGRSLPSMTHPGFLLPVAAPLTIALPALGRGTGLKRKGGGGEKREERGDELFYSNLILIHRFKSHTKNFACTDVNYCKLVVK